MEIAYLMFRYLMDLLFSIYSRCFLVLTYINKVVCVFVFRDWEISKKLARMI